MTDVNAQDPSVLGEHHPHQFCFKALLFHQLLRLKQIKMAELLQDNLVNNVHTSEVKTQSGTKIKCFLLCHI